MTTLKPIYLNIFFWMLKSVFLHRICVFLHCQLQGQQRQGGKEWGLSGEHLPALACSWLQGQVINSV